MPLPMPMPMAMAMAMAKANCRWTDRQEHAQLRESRETTVAPGINDVRSEQYRPVITCSYLTQSACNCVNSA